MAEKETNLSRRQFVKTAGLAGVGAALMGCSKAQEPEETPKAVAPTQETDETPKSTTTAQEVPKRPFGKTGEEVSILSLGGITDFRQSQLLLRQAVKMGVTYWDTSERYVNGASEEGMGQYFEKYPEDRKKVFLVSKANTKDPEGLTKSLAGSLARLKTSYIDLYFLHGLDDPNALTPEVKQWVEKAKADGKFKYFGFSTHNNVENCLEGAAKLGWVDGIMMTYNYRTMATDRVKAAVDACEKAGIGLTAMKTQAMIPSSGRRPQRPREPLTPEQQEAARARLAEMRRELENAPPDELTLQLTERFRNKGFSVEQAKLKLVWDNPQIASICSAMYNMTILTQNVAAATGKVQLTRKDKDLLAFHAAQTAHQYCPGCTHHCESGSERDLPIGVVMRCLMYARDYGDRDLGKTTFQSLPADVRKALPRIDYAEAERRCPNRLPIGRLMGEAAVELA